MNKLDIRPIAPTGIREFLTWIHAELSPQELEIIESEYWQRAQKAPAPPPLEIVHHGQRISGAYFTCLPGRLAMLGAVHALPGMSQFGVLLLKTLVNRLYDECAVAQIQAAVGDRDESSQHMLQVAGFRWLADIDQMWIDLVRAEQNPIEDSLPLDKQEQQTLQWFNVNTVAESQFIELLESTFDGSLDCPELSGLREPADVLASFLLGRRLDDVPHWEVAFYDDQPVGCLLLNEHPDSMIELAYMGLVPQARHRGFGTKIVHRAIHQSNILGSSALVLGVDTRNHPAIKTYTQCGFRFHQRMAVYLAETR